jgi:tape measure domain-containing protein
MSEDLRLAIKITADGKIASAEINRVGRDVKAAMDGLEQSGKKGADAINRVGKEAGGAAQQTEKLKSSASGLASTLAAAFSTAAVIAFGRSMVQTLQSIQATDTRLRALTKSAQDYAETQDYLARLAARHHKDIDTLADSEARLLALEKSGLVTRQQNKALLEGLSNASSALGAQSAQLQQVMLGLGQALASGVVHAEELAQVTEPLPGLLQALDKATGQTAGGFRRLVNDGEITSAMFRDSLIVALREYEGAATATASNVGAKFVDLENSYRSLVKTLEAPISSVLTPILDGIAERVEIVSKGIDRLKGAIASIVDPVVAFKNRVFGFSDDKLAEIQQADIKRSIDAAFPATGQASGAQQATVDLTKYAPAAEKAATATYKVAKAHATASTGARAHASAAESLRKEEERRYEILQSNAERAVESTFDERQRIEAKYKESVDNIIQFEEAAAKRGLDVGQKYAEARVKLEQQKFHELAEITRREEDQLRQELDDIGKEVFDEFNREAKNSADEFSYQFEQASKNVHNVLSDLFASIINGDMGNIGDSLSRSLGNLAGNGFSLALERLMSGNGTAGNGGLLGWVSGLFGGSGTGGGFSSIFSGLFGNGGATGKDGGGALSGLFGGGSGGSSLSMVSGAASIVAGIMSQFKGAFGANPKSRSIGNSLDAGGQKEILDIVDMLGNIPFLWALKFAKPIVHGENQLGQSLFGDDRRPNMTANWVSNLLAPGIGQLMGWLFSSVPKGGATVNIGKNNAVNLASSFSKGGAKDFEEISIQQATTIAEAVGQVEKALHMEFGKLRVTTYNRGQDTSFAIADRTGNRYYSGMQEAKKFDLKKAADAAFAELVRANIDQLDPQYRGAARTAKTASGFAKRMGRVDELLAFTGQQSELKSQLEALDASFEKLSKRAKHLGLSLEEVEKAADRSRAAIKRSVEDQFRALAGLAPTLESALGSLNDQIIKLSTDARAVGISEDAIAKLSSQTVSNARAGYLAPAQGVLDGALGFLGKGKPVDFDALKAAVINAKTPEEFESASSNFSLAVDDAVANFNVFNNALTSSVKAIGSFVDSLDISDLSPLTPEQKYRESQGQYNAALLKAQKGDQEALASLPQLAQQFLAQSQSFYGSSGNYAKDFAGVQSALGMIQATALKAAAAQKPALSQTEAAEFIVATAPDKLVQFSQQFDATQAAIAATAPAPIVKNAVDLLEDEIAALEDQKYAIKGMGPKKKAERNAIQDQIDALKKRKKIELKKLNAKASGGWTSGLTLVGEMGPEIIDVPGSALVSNHRQTQNILTSGSDKQIKELQAQTKELQALVRLQAAANKALLDELKASREHLYGIERRARLAI